MGNHQQNKLYIASHRDSHWDDVYSHIGSVGCINDQKSIETGLPPNKLTPSPIFENCDGNQEITRLGMVACRPIQIIFKQIIFE